MDLEAEFTQLHRQPAHDKGREWRAKGDPIKVSTHDFPSQAVGKAIPYGIYDIAANEGFVNVGITAETAQLAVASIRAWWQDLGSERYPTTGALQITADCGGGNGNRIRLWKTELQKLADHTGLEIRVCHFPPGTSKWNKHLSETSDNRLYLYPKRGVI